MRRAPGPKRRIALGALAGIVIALPVQADPQVSSDFVSKGAGTPTASDLQFPKAYKSLLASADAIASAGKDLLVTDRSVSRLTTIRTALTWQLLANKFDQNISLSDKPTKPVNMPQEQTYPDLSGISLLCVPREAHVEMAAQYGYLSSVVSKVQDLAKPTPPSDLISALTLLSKKYTVDGGSGGVSPDGINKLKLESTERCKSDLSSYDVSYYGLSIRDYSKPQEKEIAATGIPSLSFLGPIGVLIDTLIGVITPVIEQVANLVDQAKREDAIRSFLSDPTNQLAIKNAGHSLAAAVSSQALSERRKAAGAFAQELAALKVKKIDLKKMGCSIGDDQFNRIDGSPSPAFMLCWRSAWDEIAPDVNSLLKIASDYDGLADAGDSRSAPKLFDQITDDLGAIRQNEISNPLVFWGDIMSLINVAKAFETALSKETRDRIHSAIDGLTKLP